MAAEASAARAMERPATGLAAIPPAPESTVEPADPEDTVWKPVLGLPCEVIVDLSLPGFKVADFLKIRPGSVINAHWRLGRDVPLRLNGMVIGGIEFEVVGDNLAVRLTELA